MSRQRYFLVYLAVLGIAIALQGCHGEGQCNPPPYADPAPHESGFVTLYGSVRLHYLDFGGTGEPLLLLAGAGTSAHVFDEFAPRLARDFHVLALTRRGFGESSQPEVGYDSATLADDIAGFVDAMGLGRVNVAGHSMAGPEMTRLALDHPEYVNRLVYLDAGYDWASSNPNPNPAPVAPGPTQAQVASAASFASYVAWTNGLASYPAADIHATSHFDCDGHFVGDGTPASITSEFAAFAAAQHPAYAKLAVPVLAIFTVPETVGDMFPWLTADSPQGPVAAAYFPGAQATLAAQRAAFAAALPAATVIEMAKTPHFLFLAAPEAVAASMRSFLTGG
jgi:non-heme chloroperoxidase